MVTRWTLTVDCQDANVVAAFWKEALGYVDRPAPRGWDSWEQWLRDMHVPEEEWGDAAALTDPDGVLPDISFLRVPEGKTVKNRLHLDLQVGGGRDLDQAVRVERIRSHVDRLVAAGGRVLAEHHDGDRLDHVVLADPEGNELCVV
ncbi:VOC family protein [Nocardioides iriomotensis]|uniref:VOC family protein n=1 Tax=Nocardioides iriomotensis TaxID=715784 RepID=A0A4Q5IWU5_9ACTN|nr:VOC family protein [Nocardioides iriomotensis]RYU09391.1 VOC family protein [Nocardioides iriomotensis]